MPLIKFITFSESIKTSGDIVTLRGVRQKMMDSLQHVEPDIIGDDNRLNVNQPKVITDIYGVYKSFVNLTRKFISKRPK